MLGTSGTPSAKTTAKPLHYRVSIPAPNISKCGHERVKVPVVVAAEDPGASVVRAESDRDLIVSPADAYDVADDGIYKVV